MYIFFGYSRSMCYKYKNMWKSRAKAVQQIKQDKKHRDTTFSQIITDGNYSTNIQAMGIQVYKTLKQILKQKGDAKQAPILK